MSSEDDIIMIDFRDHEKYLKSCDELNQEIQKLKETNKHLKQEIQLLKSQFEKLYEPDIIDQFIDHSIDFIKSTSNSIKNKYFYFYTNYNYSHFYF